jgi:hypothetical protein
VADVTEQARAEGKSGRIVALLLVPGAALLAVVMLVLRVHMQPLTIPPYSIAASSTTDLRPGGQFSLQLDPRGPLTGAVGAKAFLTKDAADPQRAQMHPWEPRFLVDKDGTIHVAGPVDTLFAGVPAGEWELDVVVGRPELLPQSPADALKGRDTEISGGAWRLLHERVRVGGGGGGG